MTTTSDQRERCKRCGRIQGWAWMVADDVWMAVVGDEGTVRCLECFDDEAERKGVAWHHTLKVIGFAPRKESQPLTPPDTPGALRRERLEEIHKRLDAMMHEEETLMDEMESLGDDTYKVTDEDVTRIRAKIQDVLGRKRERVEAIAKAIHVAQERKAIELGVSCYDEDEARTWEQISDDERETCRAAARAVIDAHIAALEARVAEAEHQARMWEATNEASVVNYAKVERERDDARRALEELQRFLDWFCDNHDGPARGMAVKALARSRQEGT